MEYNYPEIAESIRVAMAPDTDYERWCSSPQHVAMFCRFAGTGMTKADTAQIAFQIANQLVPTVTYEQILAIIEAPSFEDYFPYFL